MIGSARTQNHVLENSWTLKTFDESECYFAIAEYVFNVRICVRERRASPRGTACVFVMGGRRNIWDMTALHIASARRAAYPTN